MRKLTLLSTLALAIAWAQELRLELQRLPQPRKVEIPARLLQAPQLRTQTLGWLLPNQSYMIVPAPTNDPAYEGDTLISNGVGSNTRTNPPLGCVGTFFDSLDAVGAYAIIGNERLQVSSGAIAPSTCWNLFIDGAIAERYDIAPDLGNTDRTVSIKGVAVWILNFNGGNGCNLSLPVPAPDDGDNAYTLTYSLYNVKTQSYSIVYSSPRTGTAPDQPVRTTKKTISDVRIGNAAFNQSGTNCPAFTDPTNSHLVEILDFAYFSTPVDITDSTSYYVVVSTESYNLGGTASGAPPAYNLTDTLYFLYGPASGLGHNNHPCYNADTIQPGRSLLSWAVYDTCTGAYYGLLSSLSPTLEDWAPVPALLGPPLNRGLNWIAFPIVYSVNLTTGTWIHGDRQSIMTPYPNPAVDCLNLRLRGEAPAQVEAQLYTLDGRWVKAWPTQTIPAGEAQLTLDTGDLPAGTYLLRIQSAHARAAFQVTILR